MNHPHNFGRYAKPSVTVDLLLTKTDSNEHPPTKVLLIKRLKDPFKDRWALPGGYVNQYEEPQHAAIRECKEETSLTIKQPKLVTTRGGIGRDPRGWVITMVYKGEVLDGQKPMAADDAKELKWFNIDEAKSMKLAFDHNNILMEEL
jgi:8-oxo-dGTP diphosphatase